MPESAEEPVRNRVGRFVFGDRRGLVLWLVLLAVLGVSWRLTLGLTDSNVLANVLVALAEGDLAVSELRFPLDAVGEQHVQQGLREYDGAYYGRNYGQVALAVPVLWVLQGLSVLVDVRVLLAGAWSLTVLVAIQQVGLLTGRNDDGRLAGAAVGIGLFAASLAVGTGIDVRLLPVIALQLVNLLAAAFVGVLAYRLVGRFEADATAVAAGVAAALATPIAFWATLPKRHVFVSGLLLAGLLCFAASRTGSSRRRLARAGAYVAMGSVAWVHAFEGFFLVSTLGVVDLSTADVDGRDLGLIAGGLLLALLPTFATNVLISGNPLVPPRIVGVGADGATAGAFTTLGDPPRAVVATGALVLTAVPESVLEIIGYVVGAVVGGLATLGEPDRLWHVFVRSGNYGQYTFQIAAYEPYELSLVESMPLLGGLLALPVVAVRRLHTAGRVARPSTLRSLGPARQTDLLVGALALVFTIIYLSRLPLHSQLTVRYLLPVYVLGLYGVARLGPVGRALADDWRTVAWSYGLATVVVLALSVTLLSALDPSRAEAVQAHALVHLTGAALLAVITVGATSWPERVTSRRIGVVLGGTAGLTTAYYLLAGLEYFTRGSYALDLARTLAEFVTII